MDQECKIKSLIIFSTIVLFILITNPFLKLLLVILYIIYTKMMGSRVKILPNIILLISILIIQILTPNGLILYKVGPISITQGSLIIGLRKSSLLIGLLYLSKLMSFTNIKFKGQLGLIIRDTFYYFNQLTSGEKIKFKNFLIQIDKKLLDLKPYEESILNNSNFNSKSKNKIYIPFIITLILFSIDKLYYSF